MSDIHLRAYLMSLRGDDIETIAAELGVDVPTVERALEDAARARAGMVADIRQAVQLEQSALPPAFTTRDGLVVRLEPDLTAAGPPDHRRVAVGGLAFGGFDPVARVIDDARRTGTSPMAEILTTAGRLDHAAVLARLWHDGQPIDDEPEAYGIFDEARPSVPPPPIPTRIAPRAIAFVPVASQEEVLAALGWGGWNACPGPAEHVAILRHWGRSYGAQLRAMSNDTLEFDVPNPPTTFEAALALAREQYAYAGDIVVQGEHDTIGALGAALVNSRHWHFWWD